MGVAGLTGQLAPVRLDVGGDALDQALEGEAGLVQLVSEKGPLSLVALKLVQIWSTIYRPLSIIY